MGLSISEQHQQIRNHRIGELIAILKAVKKQNRDLDIKKFLNEICFKYNCSKRLAKEYYDLASYKVSHPYDEFKRRRKQTTNA